MGQSDVPGRLILLLDDVPGLLYTKMIFFVRLNKYSDCNLFEIQPGALTLAGIYPINFLKEKK